MVNLESAQVYGDTSPYKNPPDHPAEQELFEDFCYCEFCGKLMRTKEERRDIDDGIFVCVECYEKYQDAINADVAGHIPTPFKEDLFA